MRRANILVVDDEEPFRNALCDVLISHGHEVRDAGTGEDALGLLEKERFDLIICDLHLPGLNGLVVLRKCQEVAPSMGFIMITAYGDVETAVKAVKLGADDYLTKPFIFDDLILRIDRQLEHAALQRSHAALEEELVARYEPRAIVGDSPGIQKVREMIRRVAPTSSNILILGESGTGKEVVARAIHRMSGRADQRLVAVNCAALPESLMESELFGHRKGAFTGASHDKEGFFKAADGSTLFLDEIGAMPLSLQSKLLRAIESKEVIPVGTSTPIEIDVRILSATSLDVEEATKRGAFMEALYYRLNVVEVCLPPLRERRTDIPLLAKHFVEQLGKELKKPVLGIDEDALAALVEYDWPGNVRELENAIERAMILIDGDHITKASLPMNLQRTHSAGRDGEAPFRLRKVLQRCEAEHIAGVLAMTGQDKVKAAKILGISLSSLYRKLEKAEEKAQEPASADV